MLPGGLHKTQKGLMICLNCTHAESFKALTNKKIGVLVIPHVLLVIYMSSCTHIFLARAANREGSLTLQP